MRVSLLKVTSVFLVLLFPLSIFAGETGAMIAPSGNVNLNGRAINRATAVFPGDQIVTSNGSGALTMTGGTVQVAPKSSVAFEQNGVTVSDGGAQVATTSGVAGHVKNVSITPAAQTAKYSFGVRDGKVLIAALDGKLILNDGRQQMALNAGSAVSMPVQDQANDKKQNKKDKAAAGAAAGAGAGAGAAAAGVSLSTAAMVGIVAATAAVSAGLSYGITKAVEPSASPSQD